MPKGPNGQKRPADVVSAAVMVGKLATARSRKILVQRLVLARAASKAELSALKYFPQKSAPQ